MPIQGVRRAATSHDQVGRSDIATETVNSNVTWRQDFDYDRFGNRTFNAANATTLPPNNAVYNPSINPADNKFDSSDGYSYDGGGKRVKKTVGNQETLDENKSLPGYVLNESGIRRSNTSRVNALLPRRKSKVN